MKRRRGSSEVVHMVRCEWDLLHVSDCENDYRVQGLLVFAPVCLINWIYVGIGLHMNYVYYSVYLT